MASSVSRCCLGRRSQEFRQLWFAIDQVGKQVVHAATTLHREVDGLQGLTDLLSLVGADDLARRVEKGQ